MSNKSLVSLIVPCYNQSEFISETLDSILCQTYNFWECIIINDGSIDNSEEIILDYCKRDSRFKYIYQQWTNILNILRPSINSVSIKKPKNKWAKCLK